MVPAEVADTIKRRHFFGYRSADNLVNKTQA
jgi:hypothetical protein